MLQITIPGIELWDERNQLFITREAQTLELEHSLVSLSKWESKWCKPFLSKNDKTDEEILDYIRCMTLTPNVSPDTYLYLTPENNIQIQEYINAPMTATTFPQDNSKGGGREIVTAELIYYWMIAHNIPLEWETRHLNRLLTLIRVCNVKNAPPKKYSQQEIMRRNSELNAARKQKLNTRG
jgi:hypothetical protein